MISHISGVAQLISSTIAQPISYSGVAQLISFTIAGHRRVAQLMSCANKSQSVARWRRLPIRFQTSLPSIVFVSLKRFTSGRTSAIRSSSAFVRLAE